MKLKSLILLAFVAALSACSFDKNDSLTDSNEIARREKAKKAFKSVSGTYTGTIEASNGTQTIQVRLYMLERDNGNNSNGVGSKMPELFASYKKVQPIGPGYDFTASYLEETRELVLVNTQSPLFNDDVHTMNLELVNDHLIGKATYRGGYQGNIDLVLTTRESAGNGGSTEDNEYYDALRRQYQEIAGDYEGKLITPDGKLFIDGTMALQVYNRPAVNDSSISIPYLLGTFHDVADVIAHDPITNAPIGFSDLTLTVGYNTDVVPRRLNLTGTPVNGNSKFTATFDLVILNGELHGTYQQAPILRSCTVIFKKKAPAKTDKN